MRRLFIAGMALCVPVVVHATTGGPSYLKVRDVRSDDTLQIRAEPYPSAPALGSLAANATRVPNLECLETADLVFYLTKQSAPARAIERIKPGEFWCKIRHPDMPKLVGWVNGRFVMADASGDTPPIQQENRQKPAEEVVLPQTKPPNPTPPPVVVQAESSKSMAETEAGDNPGPIAGGALRLDRLSWEESMPIRDSFGLKLYRFDETVIGCKAVDVADQYFRLNVVKRNRDNVAADFIAEKLKTSECTEIPPGTVVQIGHKEGVERSCIKTLEGTECLWASTRSEPVEYKDLAYLAASAFMGKNAGDGFRFSANRLTWVNPPRVYMNYPSDPWRSWEIREVIVRNSDPKSCVVDEVFVKPDRNIDASISRRYRFSKVDLKKGLQEHGALFDGSQYHTMAGENSYCTLKGTETLNPQIGTCSNEMKFARLSAEMLTREASMNLKEIFDRFCRAR